VIEEFLRGEEVSFIALCDGRDVVPLAPTQDHKAVFDGDTGPNTGGMGAYCDGAILTEAQTRMILDRVIYPTVEAMRFTGFLYAGLMMTADGPKVLEFNVRLGDPETQPLMHRMESDFVPALMAAASGELRRRNWSGAPGRACAWCWPRAGIRARTRPARRSAGSTRRKPPAPRCSTRERAWARPARDGGGRVLGVTAAGQDLGRRDRRGL
jgi:phosphoribosylamine--glycine ligase